MAPLVSAGVSLAYLVLLQVMAFILALATSKVKIKVLNDSKEMAIIIYTTSVVLLVLAIITFGLNSYSIVTEVLFSGGIMLATTIVLALLFVPKVCYNYYSAIFLKSKLFNCMLFLWLYVCGCS